MTAISYYMFIKLDGKTNFLSIFILVITTYLLYLMDKSIIIKDLVQAVKSKNVTIEHQRLSDTQVHYFIEAIRKSTKLRLFRF